MPVPVASATITGTFVDGFGNPIQGLTVAFQLETFQPQEGPWLIPGLGILDVFYSSAITNSLGEFSITVWGNDIIEVAGGGSYYAVLAGEFAGLYQFLQGSNQDLLTFPPLIPFPATSPVNPPAGSQAANSFYAGPVSGVQGLPVFRAITGTDIAGALSLVVPTGTIPGSVFTLASAPIILFRNGLFQTPTIDYTLSGLTITYVNPMTTGETHIAIV